MAHYNSCPFMAMEPTKLKYFKIWTTKKKGKSLPFCSLHPYHLKKKGKRSIAGYSPCCLIFPFLVLFPVLPSALPSQLSKIRGKECTLSLKKKERIWKSIVYIYLKITVISTKGRKNKRTLNNIPLLYLKTPKTI